MSALPPVPHLTPIFDRRTGLITQVWADWFTRLFQRVGGSSAYTNDEIAADDFVTFARMQNIATDRLIGRDTALSGNPEELTVGGGLEFTGSGGIQRSALTGDVAASAGSGSTTIGNGVVSFAKMLSTDWTKDTSASGYTKLPNGIYLQWGVTGSLSTGTTNSISFPTSFPNACRQVVTSPNGNSASSTVATGHWGTGNYSTSGFDLYNRTSISLTFSYLAVGY